jgi:hypothetical protein
MEDGFRIPSAPEQRISHLRVGVPRTEAVRDAERGLEICTLVAVPVNTSIRLYSL